MTMSYIGAEKINTIELTASGSITTLLVNGELMGCISNFCVEMNGEDKYPRVRLSQILPGGITKQIYFSVVGSVALEVVDPPEKEMVDVDVRGAPPGTPVCRIWDERVQKPLYHPHTEEEKRDL